MDKHSSLLLCGMHLQSFNGQALNGGYAIKAIKRFSAENEEVSQ
jgi:hypothetical protein